MVYSSCFNIFTLKTLIIITKGINNLMLLSNFQYFNRFVFFKFYFYIHIFKECTILWWATIFQHFKTPDFKTLFKCLNISHFDVDLLIQKEWIRRTSIQSGLICCPNSPKNWAKSYKTFRHLFRRLTLSPWLRKATK